MAKQKLALKPATAVDLLTVAVRANTLALRSLTKRLNEQSIDTDAVSVTPLPERWGEEFEEWEAKNLFRGRK
jgi:adenosylcobinamide amidohydrolase